MKKMRVKIGTEPVDKRGRPMFIEELQWFYKTVKLKTEILYD